MSFAEIEAELDQLGPDALRRLALKSWTAFVQKEGRTVGANECDESDPRLLTALDEALRRPLRLPARAIQGATFAHPD
jgi:hypothetical protein